IYSINKMIRDVFSHMAQTGYHKKRLGEMAPELRQMDPLFSHYYEEKILNSLLNACTLALDADSGSVMTLEKGTNMLNIKVASKLDEDVINKTNIKLGDGIAGLAAATSKPIILPQDEDKSGLSGKLKRNYIKSSMIVPFNRPFNKESSSDVYGVVNLNMVRKDKNFSEKDIAFVQEMINLVSIALIPIQKPATKRSINP
ncbi:MAG: GAF domain-containing protein, partial [Candidatus Omnitrophica bacterium]|nr:GAF domain-containing protein [Candidatus Omnitrophota bacterium]